MTSPEEKYMVGRGIYPQGPDNCGCHPAENVICFKHKLRTIQFGTVGTSPKTAQEKRWERDMPAYQRLRRNGLQPKGIDGCADLEQRATSQTEVEMGNIFPKDVLPKVEEGMALCKELDWTPQESVRAMKDSDGNK